MRLHLTTSANCMLNIIACWTMDLSVVCCKVGWGNLEQNFFHVALKAVPLAFCGYVFVGDLWSLTGSKKSVAFFLLL